MANAWDKVTIGDVARRVTKGTTPTSLGGSFTLSGISFVKVESITENGTVDRDKLAYIDEKTNALLKRSVLEPNDILFSIAGTIGRTARVLPDLLPANTNQALAIIRPDESKVDVGYLLYSLRDRDKVQHALSRIVQSVQANLSLSQLSAIEISLPPMNEQRAIAAVLGGLDDKIAANTKLAGTTGQLARLVYTSMLANATETPLSKTADFVNGKAFTKGASGTGRVVIRIAELNSGIGGSTVYSDAEVEDKHIARAGDLLFAWSGSLTLHRWYREDAIINQHIFKVIPREGYPLWLVDQLLQSKIEHFKAVAADKATTMGHIQRRHLDEPVLVPNQDAIRKNSVLMEGLWNLGLLAEQENEKLAATRDALLPQLMSGQLRVSDL